MTIKINSKSINIEIRKATNFFQKLKGLMFTSEKNFNYALIFYMPKARERNGLHMLFVFYSILCIFLDENKKVVDKVILKPFCPLYIPKKECNYIIELPTKYENNIKLNDKIEWT